MKWIKDMSCKDAMTRNIKEYNEKFISRKLNPENGHTFLPYIVLVIDEFADLITLLEKRLKHLLQDLHNCQTEFI